MTARHRALLVGLVGLALVVGVGVGRVSVGSCAEVRDEYAAIEGQIRVQLHDDIDAFDPQLLDQAFQVVTSRRDCFASQEIDQIQHLHETLGPRD